MTSPLGDLAKLRIILRIHGHRAELHSSFINRCIRSPHSLSWRIRPAVASHAFMSSSASIFEPSARNNTGSRTSSKAPRLMIRPGVNKRGSICVAPFSNHKHLAGSKTPSNRSQGRNPIVLGHPVMAPHRPIAGHCAEPSGQAGGCEGDA